MNPNPIIEAHKHYEKFELDLLEDWSGYSLWGVCLSTPDIFIMARKVVKGSEKEKVLDILHRFPEEKVDCWHIHYYSGQLSELFKYEELVNPGEPPLPWICFERSGEHFKYFERDRIERIAS